MNKDAFLIIRGTLDWAKIVGKARKYTGDPKFDKGPEWTMDVTPDAKSLKLLAAHGISNKLREPKGKDTRKEKYLSLRVLENKSDGTKNDPPKVTDVTGTPWDKGNIGNGSVADVKVKVKDYGTTVGVYLQAVRVVKHVEYNVEEFPPMSEDDEYFGASEGESPDESEGETELSSNAAPTPNLDDLDDDVPE